MYIIFSLSLNGFVYIYILVQNCLKHNIYSLKHVKHELHIELKGML